MSVETRYQEGDLDLEKVVEEYGSSIIKYCYSLLWDYHEAQDAAQEVFLTATVKLDSLRDGASLVTWLYRIAHNTCIDMLRRKKRAIVFFSQAASENCVDEYEDNHDYGISRELQEALCTLSPKDRALVYNRAVDEMDYCQLEEIYGVKPAALRKRYERARKKLLKELGKGESYYEYGTGTAYKK